MGSNFRDGCRKRQDLYFNPFSVSLYMHVTTSAFLQASYEYYLILPQPLSTCGAYMDYVIFVSYVQLIYQLRLKNISGFDSQEV